MQAPDLHEEKRLIMRSLLFVPGDQPDKMKKALDTKADALILDLEDSVTLPNKQRAREETASFLQTKHEVPLIVRVNSFPSDLVDADLGAVMPHHPAMIMLPKAEGGKDVQHLGAKLAVHEAKAGCAEKTSIIALVTETPAAIFVLGSYQNCSERLIAMTWGAEDLSAATGSQANRDGSGDYTEPYKLVRHLALFAAAAANAQAIDGVYANFKDADGARLEAKTAFRDGFTGKLAIHPSQVDIFNEAFTPDQRTLDEAKRIVEAFSKPGAKAGVVNFNGVMLDRPHLARAERLIANAKALKI
jgi:citrate lyase subunit beta/citryl-CoA lyase